jgi:membrane-bound lytic murein transglycosylase D
MRMANWFIPCINLVMRFRRIVSSTKGEFVMQRSPFLTTARCFILACAAVFMASAATANPFPQHDVIAPNVAFWTQIYSTYATHQAVVHDDRDLSIIYDVITLKPATAIGARKTNRQRMKKARAKYRALLRQLASNPRHAGVENRRIAALFGPSATAATFSRAARQVRCQIGQKDRFKAGLVRSGAYIEEIRAIFQSYGLPEELAYLPHVESSFNISAYSKFGAAGMWQFTRSTGKRFMKVDYVLDERRDPIKATHAAARLLLDNYSKLQSWPLAITAYNHGAAGMAKAKNAHGDYAAIVTRYRSRTFKFASRNFYSEFLAAMQVASDYRSYFGEITLDRPRPSRTVELKGYADLEGLCTHFNVSRETVKALNPALRDPVFQGQKLIPKGYALRLPNTEDTDSAIPLALYREKQKPSYFYTVQRGDTAGKIARRHGVRLTDLILANNLSRRATIYPKQTLRIPHNDRQGPAPPPQPVTVAARSVSPETEAVAVPVAAEPTPAVDSRYPEPVLASVIPMTMPDPIQALTQAAVADGPVQPSSEVVTADVKFLSISEHRGRPVGRLQVEVEETLGHYADWAHVRTQTIRSMNRLRFGSPLHLHQQLTIPLSNISAQDFEEQRYEFHKRLQEDFYATYTVSTTEPYRVQRGDSFWTLCQQKFDVPMWLLANTNPEVDFADLRVHQKLQIPTVELRFRNGTTSVSMDDLDSDSLN